VIDIVFAAALLLSDAAPAPIVAVPMAAPSDAAKSGAGAKVSRNDQLLCRSEKVLGSLIPREVCYTRAEQEDRSQQDQMKLNRLQSQFGARTP
jgi:hypothetical protein